MYGKRPRLGLGSPLQPVQIDTIVCARCCTSSQLAFFAIKAKLHMQLWVVQWVHHHSGFPFCTVAIVDV